MKSVHVGNQVGRWAVVAALALLAGCQDVPYYAAPGSTLTMVANPEFVASHGGVSVISVLVIEPAGTPAPDGTEVQCFTNLGSLDPDLARTKLGVARLNFIADSRSGKATVICSSGGPAVAASGGTATSGSTASVTILVGNPNVTSIILRAEPSRITNSRSTHVIAQAFDASGNFVANVPVIFSVVANPATEYMDSQGQPIFTNQNGEAEDVMRTRRDSSGTATVRATVPLSTGGVTATVDIAIVF